MKSPSYTKLARARCSVQEIVSTCYGFPVSAADAERDRAGLVAMMAGGCLGRYDHANRLLAFSMGLMR